MLKKFNDYPYKNEPTFGNKFLLVNKEKIYQNFYN